ncbi:hypothetical protein MUO32_26360 [Shinella sp. CPCC 101442]|uniref:hypothetical protein n=1 Tax=Shinella sp. CPCC 101442 TaxID=2932265 RepID=UPI00215355EA|nr:hypothetical protein [Shinella sp. CPCC 101442]MCR6502555.1 hypothetical protein [Shinella sp. CPCC 101442]
MKLHPGGRAISEKRKQQNRFATRDDGTGSLAVYDIFTGFTAQVNGIPLDGLDETVAIDVSKLLNAEYIARRKGTTH